MSYYDRESSFYDFEVSDDIKDVFVMRVRRAHYTMTHVHKQILHIQGRSPHFFEDHNGHAYGNLFLERIFTILKSDATE